MTRQPSIPQWVCPWLRAQRVSRLWVVGVALLAGGRCDAAEDFQAVEFDTTDGGHVHASLFPATAARAVVLAHGAVFNKESWYPLARQLQKHGCTCLSIDFRGYGKSTAAHLNDRYVDIIGAVAFLKAKGSSSIALVGGSMGAVAVLDALKSAAMRGVDKAIILAAPGGPSIDNPKIDKLFIVAEGDPVSARLKTICEQSAPPKSLKIFPGSAHAQHLFKGEHATELTDLIVDFLK